MKLSLKTEYALKAVLDLSLAARSGNALRKIKDIASAQGIPDKYLVQILLELNRTGLLVSIRGVHGGYRLAKPASSITLYDVVSAIEGSDPIVECLLPRGTTKKCATGKPCPFKKVWADISENMRRILSETSFEDICRDIEHGRSMYFI